MDVTIEKEGGGLGGNGSKYRNEEANTNIRVDTKYNIQYIREYE